MATAPRSGSEGVDRDWRPDESGTRARPPDADDTIEELDAGELELIEAPPPPARRSLPPAPPLRALTNERVDLDALVFDAARAPVPVIPSVPVIVKPPSRPSWGTALVLALSAMIVGGATSVVVVMTSDAPARMRRASPAVAKLDATKRPPVFEIVPLAPTPAAATASTEAPAPEAVSGDAAPERPLTRAERLARARAARREAREARLAARRASRASAGVAPAASAQEPAPAEEAAPAREEASPEELPEQPSRADVERAVASILPSLRECAAGAGVVELELHFAPSGRPTVAQAHSSDATPEQRSCIARAARSARVPPFSGAHLTVRYPAQL